MKEGAGLIRSALSMSGGIGGDYSDRGSQAHRQWIPREDQGSIGGAGIVLPGGPDGGGALVAMNSSWPVKSSSFEQPKCREATRVVATRTKMVFFMFVITV